MEPIAARNVKDIAPSEKSVLEGILGHPLAPEQQVFIVAYTPGALPDDTTRREALSRVEKRLVANQAHAENQGITADKADEAVAETMEKVRRRS